MYAHSGPISLPQESQDKQVIILYNAEVPTAESFVSGIVDAGMGSLFLTERDQADAYSYVPADWANFVKLVDDSA